MEITKKDLARNLAKTGMSYNKIGIELGVSKSTVRTWCIFTDDDRARTKKTPFVKCPVPYEGWGCSGRVYPDGVARVHMYHFETQRRMTLSQARYNMSVHLGRTLGKDEIVRHIDGPSDDISNLRVVTPEIEHQEFVARKTKPCANCGEPYVPKRSSSIVCSTACRAVYNGKRISEKYQAIPKEKKPRALKERVVTCKGCGNVFATTSRVAKYCPTECRNRAMSDAARLSNSNLTPRTKTTSVPKPPKIKIEVVYYEHECVVCENTFKSRDRNSEVCGRKKCRDIISAELERDAEYENA